VIGSLYLDLNQPWKARDELENAVRLLGEGIELVDSGKYEVIGDDGNPLHYSLRLDLAHVLHSLSYTYLALMQWQKSYDAFEDAMDIYQSELSEGESPMEWNSIATTTESSSTSMTDRLLKYFFRETEEDRIDLQDFQQGQNVTA
jgi:tetratricopeptide (TPR) repeat protein